MKTEINKNSDELVEISTEEVNGEVLAKIELPNNRVLYLSQGELDMINEAISEA